MRVVVVGAGIMGASTAYHLALRGVDVLSVERSDAGQATAAGAGIVCPWLSQATDPDWQRLAAAGAAYYPSLLERLAADGATDTGYARVGGLFVATDEVLLGAVRRRAGDSREQAPGAGSISTLLPGEARELFPPLRDDLGAVHVEGAARVDGRRLRDALLSAATVHGATRRAGSARLVLDGDRVAGVRIADDLHEADVVVVAAGAWAAEACSPLGLDLAVAPQRGQIVHLELPGAQTDRWPIVQPPGGHYLLAFPGARVVVGATRETGAGFDHRVTAGGMRAVLVEALAVAPGLSAATLVETRVGFRPASADGLPLLGTVAGLAGLVVATGLGPGGLTIGPYAGRLATQLALGEGPDLELGAYDPGRPAGPAATPPPRP